MSSNTKELTIEAIQSRIKDLEEEQAYWLDILQKLVVDVPSRSGAASAASFPHSVKHAPC